MSIKLSFRKGSLNMEVALKDVALPELMELVTKYQNDEALIDHMPHDEPALEIPSRLGIVHGGNAETDDERIAFAKDWLSKHSPSEIISKIKWETFPEKILLMGALHEALGKGEGWRAADIESFFSSARQSPPKNFARDIANAIKITVVATVTPRTYKVSRTGWLRIYDALIISIVPERFKEPAE